MEHTRIIQLILPNKIIIKINISGDEYELRNLISEIAGINPLQIKGIKDSNGNYYTLSSALKTDELNKGQKNNFYELILGKENNQISLTKNNVNGNIIFTNSPNVGNYIANYYINGIKKKNYSQFLSKSMNKINFKENNIEMFNKDLNQLMKNHKISQKEYSELITLVHEKKKELFKEIKSKNCIKENYNFDKINFNLTEKNNNTQSRTPILKMKNIEKIKNNNTLYIDNKYKLQIYEKMKDYFYEEDLEIIRLSLKYENEKVLNAINKFKEDNIISNLILIFKKFIIQYKKRKEIFGDKINYLFSTRKFDFECENENYSEEGNIHDGKNLTNINKTSEQNIKKMLKIHNQILYDYFKKFVKEKYEKLKKIYEENNYNELNYLLNEECNKYIEEEIKKYANLKGKKISNNEINKYYNLCNENNSDIQKIFHLFQTEYKFLNLIKNIYDIIIDDNDNIENEKLDYEKIKKSFINDLSKLKINENDIFKIKLLINQKNEKILNIINKYKETKKISYYENNIKQLIINNENNCFLEELLQKKPIPLNSINKNNSINKDTINHIKKILLLSKDEIKILENNYNTDSNLNKIIIDYINKSISISDLQIKLTEYIKSINNNNIRRIKIKQKTMKLNNIKKKDINKKRKELSFTPETIKKSKKELCCFLQNEEQIENKILNKQKEIINLLYKEECLDKKTFNIINKKITQDDQGLISAFEVYAISQDHIEFIETLKIIADLYDSHYESFYILLNHSSFNSSQKDKLISLFQEKNKKLIKALEKYESDLDKSTIYITFNDLISMN